MKNIVLNFIKKYKLALLITLGIIMIGLVGILLFLDFKDDSSIKEFKNNNYSLKYDLSWKINSKKDKTIILEHDKGAKLKIEVIDLVEEYKFSTVDYMLDELLYNIETQNKEYKLLYKNEETVTKNKYDGYKMLYEAEGSQVIVLICKKNDKLIMFTYEAINNYFDILLDSVQSIIYNFDTVEEKFDLNYNLKLDISDINYSKSESVEALLNKTTEYEIAAHNYHVKFSLPKNFKQSNINSTSGMYKFEGLDDGSIDVKTIIYNRNIFEYLDKKKSFNLYNDYEYLKKDDACSNFEETLDEIKSDYDSYIYKHSYIYKNKYNDDKSELRETIVLLYALNRDHILVIEIESKKINIPEKLISMIKINSSENYFRYTDSRIENGYIHSVLKRNGPNKIEEVNIKVPEKYIEIDKNSNLYKGRYYGLNFNEEKFIYDYDVEYEITEYYSDNIDSIVKIHGTFPTSYGKYKNLTYSGERIFNNKTFGVYEGGYTDRTGIMLTNNNREYYYANVNMLVYELPSGGFIIVIIKGNGFEISNEVLSELTNFEIK